MTMIVMYFAEKSVLHIVSNMLYVSDVTTKKRQFLMNCIGLKSPHIQVVRLYLQ